MKKFIQPIVAHFVWHPEDRQDVELYVESLQKMLERNSARPFSREINVPTFYWENPSNSGVEPYLGEKTVVFAFTSVNTKADRKWAKAVAGLKNCEVVPVAIQSGAFHKDGVLKDKNAIRLYDWITKGSDYAKQMLKVYVAHALFQISCSPRGPLLESMSLFLSHCKAAGGGEELAKRIKNFVDNETSVKSFFDKTEISSGELFTKRILKSVANSTMVLIITDDYSSRHWCQIEAAKAKELNRPIIALDFRSGFEDRIFPGCANVPCLHIPHDALTISDDEFSGVCLSILELAIIETIRCENNFKRLQAFKRSGVLPQNAAFLIRPPELPSFDLCRKEAKSKVVCYPDPPVYAEEDDWFVRMGVHARTALWNSDERRMFSGLCCGLSVSNASSSCIDDCGITGDAVSRLVQDISRYLLARGAKLVYGGDLRPSEESGFTDFILHEAALLKERIKGGFPKIKNYLCWPNSAKPEAKEMAAKYDEVLDLVRLPYKQSYGCGKSPDVNACLEAKTAEEKLAWALSLTDMRKKLVSSTDVRICAGGRRSGYLGSMPGVLEEITLALNDKRPLLLLGGFGGVVSDVVAVISGASIPVSLTKKWQLEHTDGYAYIMSGIAATGSPVDYSAIVKRLKSERISVLAKRVGLSTAEYKRLMVTPYVDECVFLITNGLKILTQQKES